MQSCDQNLNSNSTQASCPGSSHKRGNHLDIIPRLDLLMVSTHITDTKIHSEARQCSDFLKKLVSDTDKYESINLGTKLCLAEVVLTILKFFGSRMDVLKERYPLPVVINQCVTFVVRMKDVKLNIELAKHFIQYLHHLETLDSELAAIVTFSNALLAATTSLKTNYPNYRITPLQDVCCKSGQSNMKTLSYIVSNACLMIDKCPTDNSFLDFVESLMVSDMGSGPESPEPNIHICYQRKVLQLDNPYQRVCNIVDLYCRYARIYPEIGRTTKILLVEAFKKSKRILDYRAIVEKFVSAFNTSIRKHEDILVLQAVVQISLSEQRPQYAQMLVSLWKEENETSLYGLCHVYVSLQANHDCCNLVRQHEALMAILYKSQFTIVKEEKSLLLHILNFYTEKMANLNKYYVQPSNKLEAMIKARRAGESAQPYTIKALECFSSLLEIPSIANSLVKGNQVVLSNCGFLMVAETLGMLAEGKYDDLQKLDVNISSCLEMMNDEEQPSKNVTRFNAVLLILCVSMLKNKEKDPSEVETSLLETILKETLDYCGVPVYDCINNLMVVLEKEDLHIDKVNVVGMIVKYSCKMINKGIEVEMGVQFLVRCNLLLAASLPPTSLSPLLIEHIEATLINLTRKHPNLSLVQRYTYEQELISAINKACAVNKRVEQSVATITTQLQIFNTLLHLYVSNYCSRFCGLSKEYVQFYSVVSECQSVLHKIEAYTEKKKLTIPIMATISEEMRRMLTINNSSPLEVFRSIEILKGEFQLPDLVNIYAKLLHLIAINQNPRHIFESIEGQYDELCLKSVSLLRYMDSLESIVRSNTLFPSKIEIFGCPSIPYGTLPLPHTFGILELTMMLSSLDSLIYFAEMTRSNTLEAFVGLKISLILHYTEDKDFYLLAVDVRLRVLISMLPLLRKRNEYQFFFRREMERVQEVPKHLEELRKVLNLELFELKLNPTDPSPEDPRMCILEAFYLDHESIILGKELLMILTCQVINTVRGAYDEALQKNCLRIIKHLPHSRLPSHMCHGTLSYYNTRPSKYIEQVFSFDEIYDFDKAFMSLYGRCFLKVLDLMHRKNQLSEIEKVMPLALKVLMKSFNLCGYLEAMAYRHKAYQFSRVFDSTNHVLKALKTVFGESDKLEKIRTKIFDRRKSQFTRYRAQNLANDVGLVFGESQCWHSLVGPFVTLLFKEFSRVNYLDQFVTSFFLERITTKGPVDPSLIQIYQHLYNQDRMTLSEALCLKTQMINKLRTNINCDYHSAVTIKNVLGKMHSSFESTLLTPEDIMYVGFLISDFNCNHKERMLSEEGTSSYVNNLRHNIQKIKTNDKNTKLKFSMDTLRDLVRMMKYVPYPLVSIFPLGDSIAVVTVKGEDVKVKTISMECFSETHKDFRAIIAENNQRIDIIDETARKEWWQSRFIMEKRLEDVIRVTSNIKGFNFFDELYGEVDDFKAINKSTMMRDSKYSCVILHLEDSLQDFPFEALNKSSTIRGVYRVPSIKYLCNSIGNNLRSKGKPINMSNLSYLIDPEANLPLTRQRFLEIQKQHLLDSDWAGIIGKQPTKEEFFQLVKKKVLLYMGHGEGKCVDDWLIFEKKTSTIPLLFGCSSVQMTKNQTESHGLALTYMLSGSPLLLGCLWNITDKDLDLFFKRIVQQFQKAPIDFSMATVWSRSKCKLKYLNGLPIVIYGLPHFFELTSGACEELIDN